MNTILLLEDGRSFAGRSFGASEPVVGEVVFNTSMTGYQEIVTDPSYRGQIVVLTASQIGNTGVNRPDMESERPQVAGLVVRELSPRVSSWRAEGDLGGFLKADGIPGVTGVDTRALTLHIRSRGAMKGVIAPPESPGMAEEELRRLLGETPSMEGLDLASRVTCSEVYEWEEGDAEAYGQWGRTERRDVPRRSPRVIAMDFGIKRSILRRLVDAGFAVTVVPASTSAAEILRLEPDGVFLSNGPGDPAAVTGAIETVKELLGRKPIFGICLGHQILALALGGKTFKLKFGHRGGNHPVRAPGGGGVKITAQNHGFAVDPEFPGVPGGVEITEINLNDGTVEGIEHKGLGAFGVQYHPEAGPGPHEAADYFNRFYSMVEGAVGEGVQVVTGRAVGAKTETREPG